MLVKILKSFVTQTFSAQLGDTLEIEGKTLRDLLEAGYVEPVQKKEPSKGKSKKDTKK